MVSASFSAFNTVAVQEILAVLGAGILALALLQGSFNPSLGLGYTLTQLYLLRNLGFRPSLSLLVRTVTTIFKVCPKTVPLLSPLTIHTHTHAYMHTVFCYPHI